MRQAIRLARAVAVPSCASGMAIKFPPPSVVLGENWFIFLASICNVRFHIISNSIKFRAQIPLVHFGRTSKVSGWGSFVCPETDTINQTNVSVVWRRKFSLLVQHSKMHQPASNHISAPWSWWSWSRFWITDNHFLPILCPSLEKWNETMMYHETWPQFRLFLEADSLVLLLHFTLATAPFFLDSQPLCGRIHY